MNYTRHLETTAHGRRLCLWAALVCCALAFVAHPVRAAVTEAWVRRYSSVASNATDKALKVVRDFAGDIIVAGYTDDGSNGRDMLTIKYSGADGTAIWEKRYNGPADGDDYVSNSRCLALGPNGIVAITGHSDGNFGLATIDEYATVVYREPLPPVSIGLVPGGVRLRFTGAPGQSYDVQRASIVTGPWAILAAPIAPASGLVEYIDTPLSLDPRFYRIAVTP